VADILDGKSEEEIRRAATWWFTAQEAYQRGEYVPLGVFAISTKVGLTKSDIAWAKKLIEAHPEWLSK